MSKLKLFVSFLLILAPLALTAMPIIPQSESALRSVTVDGGGHVAYAHLTGVSSGAGAFKAGLQRIRGYFDSSPTLINAVSDTSHTITMAVFRATLRGNPVSGLIVAIYDRTGNSRVGVVYDSPTHLSKSMAPMMAQFDEMTVTGIKRGAPTVRSGPVDFRPFFIASRSVALHHVDFKDGTASIGIAPGFTPKKMYNGSFLATSSSGAYITLGKGFPMVDPNGSLYQSAERLARLGGRPISLPNQIVAPFDPNPVTAWKTLLTISAHAQNMPDPEPQVEKVQQVNAPGNGADSGNEVSVHGTMTLRNEPYLFAGLLNCPQAVGPSGGWLLVVDMVAAPLQHASQEMPSLLAMMNSLRLNRQRLREQTASIMDALLKQANGAMAASHAIGEAGRNASVASSMASARATRDAMSKSTAGFIHYISDTSVLQHNPTGGRASMDKNLASALENADPKRFSVVQMKDYVKGVDY